MIHTQHGPEEIPVSTALHAPPASWGSPNGPRFFPQRLTPRPSSVFLLPEALCTCCSLCLGCSSCLSSSGFPLTSSLQLQHCSPSLLLTPSPAHSLALTHPLPVSPTTGCCGRVETGSLSLELCLPGCQLKGGTSEAWCKGTGARHIGTYAAPVSPRRQGTPCAWAGLDGAGTWAAAAGNDGHVRR